MGIFQSLYEGADGGGAVHEIAFSCFCFELMDVHCERFIFSLLDFHEAQYIGVAIRNLLSLPKVCPR